MAAPVKKTLNPNASTFTFNPGASVFVPSFSPHPSPLNGAQPTPALMPSPALLATAAAPEFVPGKLDLGGAFAKPLPPAQQEGAKQPTDTGDSSSSTVSALEAKRPAALAVAEPAAAPPADAEPIRLAGKVKVEVKHKRYSLRVMRLLQHDQRWIDMSSGGPNNVQIIGGGVSKTEALSGGKNIDAQIEEFRRLLQQTPEIDSSQDMPDRKQADAARGTPRGGGAGTPKGGRGKKNAKDEPLRDKFGNIIQIKALEISENRWKPAKPTDEEEKVYKAVKGVLNKLTLEKFDKLYQELLEVGIVTASLLRGFVVILYDKAVVEPHFIGMYAQMCERLAKDLPEMKDEDGVVLPFAEVLVGKCRSEFEMMGKEPERENLEGLTAEDKDHKLKKLRLRTLGNVEFIGELFKKNMVGTEEIEELLDKLLDTSPEDHDSIHPLVKLLESVGKPLEAASKETMDNIFSRISELANQAGLSSRYKFMLLDLKDLRSKDWVPRRAAAGPQTLEAVKKEVDKESRFTEKPKDDKEKKKKEKEKEKEKANKKKAKEANKKAQEDDGWAQVGTPVKSKGKAQSKSGSGTNSPMSLSRQGSRENLGAGKKPVATANRGGFAALMMDSDGDDDDDDDDDDDKSAKSGSEESDEDDAEGAEEEEEGEELDEEGENKVGGVVREYLSIHDNDEAKLCVQELYAKGYPKARVNVELVKQGLMQAMDAGEREGELIGQLVAFLVKEQIITEEAVGKGFVAVLADLPDITIDIPMAPKIVAAVLHMLIDLEFVAKSVLAPGIKTLQESGCSTSWKHFEKIQKLLDE